MRACCVGKFFLVDVEDEDVIVFFEEVSCYGAADTSGTSADNDGFGHFRRMKIVVERNLLLRRIRVDAV